MRMNLTRLLARRRKSGIDDLLRGVGSGFVVVGVVPPEKDEARDEGVERHEIKEVDENVDSSVSRTVRGISSVESLPRYMVELCLCGVP
jgi:hypothetical protein